MGMVTLDQSSAFDVIEHNILQKKLRRYNFSESSLAWFRSYLSNRSQYVALHTSQSDVKLIGPYACPQGSCLGPLIWNLYCGEVAEVLSNSIRREDDVVDCTGGRNEVANKNEAGHLFQYADDVMV